MLHDGVDEKAGLKRRVNIGPLSHFGLAVRDPKKSAEWWTANFDFDVVFDFEAGICVANGTFMLALRNGDPSPETIGHMAFTMPNMAALRAACDILRENGVDLEDPGDEIGPVAEGSASMGLWFHDPDGYRWELFVSGESQG